MQVSPGHPVHRAEALRTGMLVWLFERQTADDGQVDWQDFRHDHRAACCGHLPDAREVAEQARYLVEKGLVREGAASERKMPRLTAMGWDCVAYYEGDVTRYTVRATRFAFDIRGFASKARTWWGFLVGLAGIAGAAAAIWALLRLASGGRDRVRRA